MEQILSLNSIRTFSYKEGRKIKYSTNFETSGELSKIVDSLKNSNDINISGIKTLKISEDDDKKTIKRIMTCPLPETDIVKYLLSDISIEVIYDIAYNDNMLVIKAKNPHVVDKFFKFDEELIISQEDNGKIIFSRNVHIFNFGKQIPIIGEDYQEYDDYYNNKTLSFYLELAKRAL